MKLITRDTDYAVRALCYIAQAKKTGEVCPVTELSAQLGIPRPFLRKILQALNKNGILESHKGKGGGFLLSRTTDKMLLVDLMRVFQGPLRINECIFKRRICPNKKTCSLGKKLDIIEEQVVRSLRSITISSLLDKKEILRKPKL